MLKYGSCLIFRKCEDLRDMIEDMERYQGQRIRKDWLDLCEETINKQGIVYIEVQISYFVRSKDRPSNARRYIEVKPKKSNKGW